MQQPHREKKADQNRSISCETFLHKTKELVVGEKSGIKYAAKMKAFFECDENGTNKSISKLATSG